MIEGKETINESLVFEELRTILNGGTIDFLDLEDNDIKIKINGNDFKEDYRIKFVLNILNMSEKRFDLIKNILERYDNKEYWDKEIMNNSDYDGEVER